MELLVHAEVHGCLGTHHRLSHLQVFRLRLLWRFICGLFKISRLAE
jgi:hypothetical protein